MGKQQQYYCRYQTEQGTWPNVGWCQAGSVGLLFPMYRIPLNLVDHQAPTGPVPKYRENPSLAHCKRY